MSKFEFHIDQKFLVDNMIMIIKNYKTDFNYKASSLPRNNYIVEFYDYNKNIINDRNIDFCINLFYDSEKKYIYIINERVLICKDKINI